MAVKKIGAENPIAENQIRSILRDKTTYNKDGFFIRNHGGEIRTLDKTEAQTHIENADLNNFFSHFRMASVGKVSAENVHGWDDSGWVFMHNGGVSTYVETGKSREQEEADSLMFFKDLLGFLKGIKGHKEKRVCQAIRDMVDTVNFHGRAFLYHKASDNLYMFGDFEVYDVAGSYLVISSHALRFNGDKNSYVHGFNFTQKDAYETSHASFDGVAVIRKFSTDQFKYSYLNNLKIHHPTTPSPVDRMLPINPPKKDGEWEQKDGIWQPKAKTETNSLEEMIDSWPVSGALGYTSVGYLNGVEYFQDDYGIHDAYMTCCNSGDCYTFLDIDLFTSDKKVMGIRLEE